MSTLFSVLASASLEWSPASALQREAGCEKSGGHPVPLLLSPTATLPRLFGPGPASLLSEYQVCQTLDFGWHCCSSHPPCSPSNATSRDVPLGFSRNAPTCWLPPGSWGNHCEIHLVASALHFTSPGASPRHSGGSSNSLTALRALSPCPAERSGLGPSHHSPQPWRVMRRVSDAPRPLRPCTLLPHPPRAHSPQPGQFLPIPCDFACKPSCPRS